MVSQKDISLKNTYDALIKVALFNHPISEVKDLISESFMGYGSAEDEVLFGADAFVWMVERQRKELSSSQSTIRRKMVKQEKFGGGNSVYMVEELNFDTELDGATHGFTLRLSTILDYIDDKWMVIHFHGSTADADTPEGQAWPIEEWKRRNAELEKLVQEKTAELKKQNRELEIEAALERVRAVATGMQKSEDMLNVCKTIALQLQSLGTNNIRNVQTAIFDVDKGSYMNYEYYAKHDKTFITDTSYTNHKIARDFGEKMIKGKGEFFKTHIKGKKLNEWLAYQKTTNVFIDDYLNSASSLHYYWHSLGPVALGISTYTPLDHEAMDLFQRFLNVFELAYTRYMDIEKARAQAREAQIEAALERVRSASMAMHHSSDLHIAASVLFDQLKKLGVNAFTCGFVLCDMDDPIDKQWMYIPKGGRFITQYMPHEEEPVHHDMYKGWLENKKIHTVIVEGKQMERMIQFLMAQRSFKQNINQFIAKGIKMPVWQKLHAAYFSHGYLLIITLEDYLETDIFVRFAKVFEQTYTRFLDLQKAEAQAREAQIEAALERVRAKTMAMHNSEDVGQCILKLFGELTALGVPESTRFGIGILNHENENNQLWTASKDGEEVKLHIGNLDMTLHPLLKSARKAWMEQVPLHKYVLEGEDLLNYYQMLNNAPDYKISIAIEKLPEKEIHYGFIIDQGFFYAFSPCEFQSNLIRVVQRFSSLFGQTYRRYLDLVKAEAQAREALIEAALERVRARSMAMHKSKELQEVIQVVYEQFIQLNIFIEHTGFIVDYKERDDMHIWLADQNGAPSEVTIPYFDSPHWNSFIEAKEKGIDFFANHFTFEEKNRFYQELFTHIPDLPEDAKKHYLRCDGLAISTVLLENVGLYIENFSGTPYTEEENAILMRFGKVFQQTYTRFLDLQKAEAQGREAQIEAALERLRARTMAMHHSDELSESAVVMFREFEKLELLNEGERIYFSLLDKERKKGQVWITRHDGTVRPGSYWVPYDREALLKDAFAKWLKKEPLIQRNYLGKKLKTYLNFLKSLPHVKEDMALQSLIANPPKKMVFTEASFTYGVVGIMSTQSPLDETEKVLVRFAKVFQQTYTRFLDLKKAEAQAKEAQIETALERVRSRSMAMHNSKELSETAEVLFEQINLLGKIPDRMSIGIINEESKNVELWVTDQSGNQLSHEFFFSLDEQTSIVNIYNAWKERKDSFVVDLTGQNLQDWLLFVKENAKLPIDETKIIGRRVQQAAFFSQGFLLLTTHEPVANEIMHLLVRFAKVFDQTYTRFLDLQKAEAQAREAQIEAALERVRAKTMAMHGSSDVEDTVITLFEEVLNLGLDKSIRCGIGILEGFEGMETRSTNKDTDGKIELRVGMLNMTIHPMLVGLKKAWKRGSKGYSYEFSKEDVRIYYEALNKEPEYPFNADLKTLPEKEYHNSFFFSSGIIFAFTENPLSKESYNILNRFALVFDQTYRRYLDLQKAEAQAREAQIEAALERVRARSMAMHKTNELSQVIMVLFQQLSELDLQFYQVWINIFFIEEGYSNCWFSPVEGVISEAYTAKVPLGPFEESSLKSWRAGEEFSYLSWRGLKEVDEIMKELTEMTGHSSFIEIQEKKRMERVEIVDSNHKYGVLAMAKNDIITDNDRFILKRFTKVFEQAYTRFLDLQKAEMQAHEAQIEVALERVRSRTMAIHKSEELAEVSELLFEEIRKLVGEIWACGFVLCDKKTEITDHWMSIESGKLRLAKVPKNLDKIHLAMYDAWLQKQDLFSIEIEGNELERHYKVMSKIPALKKNIQLASTFEKPDWQKNYIAPFRDGYLLIVTISPIEDAEIFSRFAKVFEQTYTRFLDLQKAEAFAKEGIMQAAIDRVRAEIASMRTAKDLERITPLIWRELTTLEVPFFRCGVFIIDEKTKQVNTFLTNPMGESLAVMQLKFGTLKMIDTTIDHWRSQKVYRDHWNKQQFIEFTQSIMDQGVIADSERYQGAVEAPVSLDLHFVPFAQGMLYVGSSESLTETQVNLIKDLANAFSVAYARYEDFNELEKAKAKVEEALTGLKAAQAQLIQAEKMASLGELTAGIAHEIKNPLNFVNNFAEVTQELIDEMKEELNENNTEYAKEIADDIIQNLQKILHHGQRADGIVKGMLQHSRTSDGVKELTDINELADEYLRLAYHGLKAKDKSFNAAMELDLNDTLPKISVIPQEIGRVLLNLITNAFHAVSERAKSETESYKPKVIVSSHMENGYAKITVQDNGSGIPDEIKDKIFQPFFTTKPTGEGTGLGLSLSYDIVKAHGGELEVESIKNEGTKLIITLP